MEYIKLTKAGPLFSRIVAGCMHWGTWGSDLSVKETEKLIQECIELGITTFDHADIYGDYTTEALFGNALKQNPLLKKKIQIVTKCGIKLITPNRPQHQIKSYDTSKNYIINQTESSLKNLNVDVIDLLLIHRPSPLMHPEEIAEAFQKLKKEGKVKCFGASNFTNTQFNLLNTHFDLVTNQIEISPLHLDPFTDGSLDLCFQNKIHPMAYSVLAGGKLFTDKNDQRIQNIRKVGLKLSEKYQAELDQILIAWLLKHPSQILPILGSTKKNRLKNAVNALNIKLTDEDWFFIYEASLGKEVA